jgi:uncharacterized membrane protein (UPF0127 family)
MKVNYLFPIAALLIIGCQAAPVSTGSGNSSVTPVSGTTGSAHIDSVKRQFHLKDLQRVTLKANGHDIPAWVMDDKPKQEEGMMWLVESDVNEGDGMIFVFPKAAPQGFWMKNTILALDIMFISQDKKLLNVQPGRPYDDQTNLPSKGAAMYVLEMRQGAAKRLGLKPGTVFTIPADVKAKE